MKDNIAIKELTNTIIGGMVVVVIIMMLFYGLSFTNMNKKEMNLNENYTGENSFRWEEIYNLYAVKYYKYEILRVDSELNYDKEEGSFRVSNDGEKFDIKIMTYDGAKLREGNYHILLDMTTYTCRNKIVNGIKKGCDQKFNDRKTDLVTNILPNIMRKKQTLRVERIERGIYNKKTYDAIVLTGDKLKVWKVDKIPIPIRIEYEDKEGNKYIGKLELFKN